jgi:hypothetical protein
LSEELTIPTNDKNSNGKRKNGGQAYGPHNPHPLSTRKTELVWEGKYDGYGNRREVEVAGAALPMQKIETIDPARSGAGAVGLAADMPLVSCYNNHKPA